MAIVRRQERKRYTAIDRELLQNPTLSFAARGLMGYLLSKPDTWQCQTEDIEREGKIKKVARRRLFKEAETAGYITFEQSHDEKGRFTSAYVIHEEAVEPEKRTKSWEANKKTLKLSLQPDAGFRGAVDRVADSRVPANREPYMISDVETSEGQNSEQIREESLKPSLTAPAVANVLPLFSASPQPSNNSATDKPTPSVHDVRVADSFAVGGESSPAILPQVAPGCVFKADPHANSLTSENVKGRLVSVRKPKAQRVTNIPKLPSDPRANHPAIAAVRDLAKRFPKDILWDKIIERLGDTPVITKLKECYLAHVERGYNPNSWIWATEWYQTGIPQNNVKQKKERTFTSYEQLKAADAELNRSIRERELKQI